MNGIEKGYLYYSYNNTVSYVHNDLCYVSVMCGDADGDNRLQVMAEDYELLLNKILNSLRRCQDYVSETFSNEDLSGLEMVVDG